MLDHENATTTNGETPQHQPGSQTPSWIDRLISTINGLPGSGWYLYPLALVVELVVLQSVTWLDGSVPWGHFSSIEFLMAMWTVLPVAVIHYLDISAGRTLRLLRPSLALDDDDFDRMVHLFATMPSRRVLLANVLGILSLWVLLAASPFLLDRAFSSTLHTAAALLVVTVNFALMGALVYHTVRQLRLVARTYAIVKAIDLFQLAPLYAPSVLTAQTAIFWVLALYLSVALFSDIFSSTLAVAVVISLGLIAALTFLLPLITIHRRIVEEKERAIFEIDRRINRAIEELERRSDALDLRDMDGINKMILGLIAGRDHLGKIPTWPWTPGTPTAVISALVLPIVLWLVQVGLERFIRP